MLTRISLFVASLAAAAMLVVSVVALGLWPPLQSHVAAVAQPAAQDVAGAAAVADPSPTPQVDTIYLAAPPPQQTITVHRVVRSTTHEDGEDGEREGSSDD